MVHAHKDLTTLFWDSIEPEVTFNPLFLNLVHACNYRNSFYHLDKNLEFDFNLVLELTECDKLVELVIFVLVGLVDNLRSVIVIG